MDRNELLQQKIQQKTYEQRNYSKREIFNEYQSHHETNSQHISSRKHWSGANSSSQYLDNQPRSTPWIKIAGHHESLFRNSNKRWVRILQKNFSSLAQRVQGYKKHKRPLENLISLFTSKIVNQKIVFFDSLVENLQHGSEDDSGHLSEKFFKNNYDSQRETNPNAKLLHDLKTKRKGDRVTRSNKGPNKSDIVLIESHTPVSFKDFIMKQEVVAKAKHSRQPTMTQSQKEIMLSNLDPGDAGLSPNHNQSLDLTSQKSCDDGETSLNKGFPFKADKNNDYDGTNKTLSSCLRNKNSEGGNKQTSTSSYFRKSQRENRSVIFEGLDFPAPIENKPTPLEFPAQQSQSKYSSSKKNESPEHKQFSHGQTFPVPQSPQEKKVRLGGLTGILIGGVTKVAKKNYENKLSG
jgi:hypothetical protein